MIFEQASPNWSQGTSDVECHQARLTRGDKRNGEGEIRKREREINNE